MGVNQPPTLEIEHSQFGPRCQRVAGMDEVGRGALAGPVTVGVAVVSDQISAPPPRLRDSKLLRPAVRQLLVPQIQDWALAVRTGSATPWEIDALGIVGALRLAGCRALAELPVNLRPDIVLLDGVHDWLSGPGPGVGGDRAEGWPGTVQTVVKGDLCCASIAAASVVAKVERDQLMTQLHQAHPDFGWAANKGYGSAAHRAALQAHGASVHHRRSWNLGVRTTQVARGR